MSCNKKFLGADMYRVEKGEIYGYTTFDQLTGQEVLAPPKVLKSYAKVQRTPLTYACLGGFPTSCRCLIPENGDRSSRVCRQHIYEYGSPSPQKTA